jgi:hypothetical protein
MLFYSLNIPFKPFLINGKNIYGNKLEDNLYAIYGGG